MSVEVHKHITVILCISVKNIHVCIIFANVKPLRRCQFWFNSDWLVLTEILTIIITLIRRDATTGLTMCDFTYDFEQTHTVQHLSSYCGHRFDPSNQKVYYNTQTLITVTNEK